MGATSSKQHASFVPAPRDIPQPTPSTSHFLRPLERPPPSKRTFPPELGPVQVVPAGVATGDRIPSKQQPAPSVPLSCVLSPLSSSTAASSCPISPPPSSSQSFSGSQQSSFSAPIGAAFASSTPTSQQHAPLVNRWHPNLPLIPPELAAHLSRRPKP